jgi:hypothetical protein
MTTSEKYLHLGKEQMIREKKSVPANRWDVETLSTQTAQEISNTLTQEDELQLLLERPDFFTKESRWPEVESQYFTVHWVLVHLLCDWLEDELERYGKEHLTLKAGESTLSQIESQ